MQARLAKPIIAQCLQASPQDSAQFNVPQLRESETLSEILEPIQLAYLAVALGGLACFLAFCALLLHGRSTLKVRRLELRDEKGHTRAALSLTEEGVGGLGLYDDRGRLRGGLGV